VEGERRGRKGWGWGGEKDKKEEGGERKECEGRKWRRGKGKERMWARSWGRGGRGWGRREELLGFGGARARERKRKNP